MADYRAKAGGTFPGLPDHLALFNKNDLVFDFENSS